MEIDKRNGNVKYNDANHVYWDDNGRYISVTTLINQLSQPFDKDFWSAYKALEKILTKDQFKIEKKNLLETRKIDLKYLMDMYEFSENDFNKAQQDILDDWQKKNIESCERGTKIHAELEHSFTKKKETDLKKFGLGGKFLVNTNKTLENNNLELLDIEKGVFPEYLIYRTSSDGKFKLAGQIDLLIKDGNDIYIYDYKGLPLDTPIATINGWTTIKDIKEGDIIFDKDGNTTKVVHKSNIHYNPCYKIVFDNNNSIIADHEHRWLISFRRQEGYIEKVMTTEELYEWIKTHDRSSYNIPKILNPKPINTPKVDLPIDPYVLGVWLGDGSKSCGLITQHKGSKLWDEIIKRGYTIGNNTQHNLDKENVEMRTIYGLSSKLKELNLLQNKHIPNIFLRASYEQRLDLLRGFMDTDGYYNPGRKRFVMSTGQEWQKNDLIKLLATFGIKCSVFNIIKKLGDKKFNAWNICFSTVDFNPFLVRNQEIKINLGKNNRTFRNIIKIEPVDTIPTQCIEVDSLSHTFLFGYEMIVTHNTNAKLEDKSFFDSKTRKNQMMKYPLNNLMDCNKVHYTLQLSTYAWMLQMLDPKFNIKKLTLIHYDHEGNVTEHVVDYLKDDVIRMCKWHKKQTLLKEKADSRKPIEF